MIIEHGGGKVPDLFLRTGRRADHEYRGKELKHKPRKRQRKSMIEAKPRHLDCDAAYKAITKEEAVILERQASREAEAACEEDLGIDRHNDHDCEPDDEGGVGVGDDEAGDGEFEPDADTEVGEWGFNDANIRPEWLARLRKFLRGATP